MAIAPLLALAERVGPRRAFRLGWLAGATGVAMAFWWLTYAIRVFGGFPSAVALLLYAPVVAWLGAQLGVFLAAVAWLGAPLALAAPLAFTTIEFLFPSLFPWRLANSQYRVPLLLQTGEIAGPSLLTFAIVWMNVAVLATSRRIASAAGAPAAPTQTSDSTSIASVAAPAVLVVALVAYGAWRLPAVRAERDAAPGLRVAIVQGNVSVEQKGDRLLFSRNLDRYRESTLAAAPDVDLVVWPETVVQQRIAAAGTRLAPGVDPFPDAPRPLLFGGIAAAYDTPGATRLYNSAFLRAVDGRILGRYDKRILVPFGEYMPFGDRFPRLRELSPATSNFAAGSDPEILPLTPVARLGALICYEDVIPGPARAAVAAGATLLVNLTNDAWYGDSAEPVQHQALAVWRTVETRRDLVRSTNTGLTSMIAATGDVLGELPTFTTATLTSDARLLTGTTVYAAVGDVFAWAVVAATVVLALRRSRPPALPYAERRRRSRARIKGRR